MTLDASSAGSDALCATLDLARRADRAEIEFCALAGEVGSIHGVERLEAGGGLALYSKPGSPLNKVLGLGLGQTVSNEDLDRIEAFYAERRIAAQIELCPLAASDLAARLNARGFVLQGFENELARRIGPRIAFGLSQSADVRVTQARPDQDDLWIRVTAEGFAAFEPPVSGGGAPDIPSMDAMIEMMSQFAHHKIRRYLAWVGDEPAGGGAAWAYNGVLGIFGTSTLARFRRRGVQRAITVSAIEDVAAEADLAITTTAPGSTSQRTFERLGFRVLYTRAILVKSH
jgi:hypothetical protein